jgi:opacity protein-like surface antigen
MIEDPLAADPRRRSSRTLCAIVTTLLLAAPASARADEPFDLEVALYAAGGLSIPLGPSDFTDGWEQGWNAGGGIGYRLSPRSEIRTLIFYNRFDLNTTNLTGISGGAYSIVEASADYKLYLTGLQAEDRLALYLVGGVGFGGQTIAETTFPEPLGTTQKFTRTKLAYDLGAGVDFRVLPKTAIFAEAKWVLVRTRHENTTYSPLRAGVRFLIAE